MAFSVIGSTTVGSGLTFGFAGARFVFGLTTSGTGSGTAGAGITGSGITGSGNTGALPLQFLRWLYCRA